MIRSMRGFGVWLAMAASVASGCTQEVDPGFSTQAVEQGTYPEIDFSSRPSYLPSNVVNLTFDDGPDWNNTARVLDVLKEKGVKASFYINSENWSNLNTDAPMQDLVRRMVNEGHELASHTARHQHLGQLGAEAVEAEIANVENAVNRIFGANAPRLTLLRAPFGEPYQGNNPAWPNPGYNVVAPIVARHAVHMGWSIDSFDYNCAGNPDCVYNNVKSKIDAGDYGVILFHSVHAQTADSIGRIIDYLRSRNMQFWSSEQVVRARYGKSSAELVDGGGGDDSSGDDSGDDSSGDDSSGDDGSGDDSSGDDGSGDDGSGDDGSGDDGSACDAPAYQAGVNYGPGDLAASGGSIYRCKPWPYSGWCSTGGAYTPGTGWAWQMAWDLAGSCN